MISRPLGISVWSVVTGRKASGVSRHAGLGHDPWYALVRMPIPHKGITIGRRSHEAIGDGHRSVSAHEHS